VAAESFQSHELLIRVRRIERKLNELIVSELSPETTNNDTAKADEAISL
jgi:hypothetical protein